jgi:hypothetical protein
MPDMMLSDEELEKLADLAETEIASAGEAIRGSPLDQRRSLQHRLIVMRHILEMIQRARVEQTNPT